MDSRSPVQNRFCVTWSAELFQKRGFSSASAYFSFRNEQFYIKIYYLADEQNFELALFRPANRNRTFRSLSITVLLEYVVNGVAEYFALSTSKIISTVPTAICNFSLQDGIYVLQYCEKVRTEDGYRYGFEFVFFLEDLEEFPQMLNDQETENKIILPVEFRSADKGVQVSSEVPRDVEALSRDFCHFLEKQVLPDVRLECGSETFQAHRSILAARSEVFRAMFQSKMLERETGVVQISDMDATVLQKMLHFMYSGKPGDLSESSAADLYEAADKYNVASLKAACFYWMIRNLTEGNCVRFLQIATSHSDLELKDAVISFIVDNPSVMTQDSWLSLSRELPSLANEVYQAYVTSAVGSPPNKLRRC